LRRLGSGTATVHVRGAPAKHVGSRRKTAVVGINLDVVDASLVPTSTEGRTAYWLAFSLVYVAFDYEA